MHAEFSPLRHATQKVMQQATRPYKERLSIRAIAREEQVKRLTLHHRLKLRRTSRNSASLARQEVLPSEEVLLCQWVQDQGLAGMPPSPGELRMMALRLRHIRKGLGPEVQVKLLGKNWVEGFKKRNPGARAAWTRARDSKRVEGVCPEAVQPFYAALKKKYPPSMIFKMDETGYAIGDVAKRRGMIYSGGAARKQATVLQTCNPRGEWVTTIECITAAGKALDPLVIYKGACPNHAWLVKDQPHVAGWHYSASPKGWSNNLLGYKWLWKVFDKQTRTPDNACRLLIVDGHGSHVSAKFACFCMLNKINLVVLPPHTSHKLQPLDVGVFAPLKAAMKERCRVWAGQMADPNKARMNKMEWTRELGDARAAAMVRCNIEKGWSKSGLYPLNPTKVAPYPDAAAADTAPLIPVSNCRRRALEPTESLKHAKIELYRKNEGFMNTPVRAFIWQAVEAASAARADLNMYRHTSSQPAAPSQTNGETQVPVPKKKHTYIYSHHEMVAALKAKEAKKRRGKGKGRAAQESGPELSADGGGLYMPGLHLAEQDEPPQEVEDVFGGGGAFGWDDLEPIKTAGPSRLTGLGAHVDEDQEEDTDTE